MKILAVFITAVFLFLSCQKDEKYQIPYPEEGRYDCAEFIVNDTRERGFFTSKIDGELFFGTSVIAEDEFGDWSFIGVSSDDNCVRRAVLRIIFNELSVPLEMEDFPLDHRECHFGVDSTVGTVAYDSRSFRFSWTTSDQTNATYSCKSNDYKAQFEMDQYHRNNEVIEGTFSAILYRDTSCMRNLRYSDEIKIEDGYFQAVIIPFVN